MPRTSLLDRLDQQIIRRAAIAADPWKLAVERLKGRVDPVDRIEQIAASAVADLLEVPQRARTSATARRIAKLMRELRLGTDPLQVAPGRAQRESSRVRAEREFSPVRR